MKKHCRIIAAAVRILGILYTLISVWQVRYSVLLMALVVVTESSITYVMFVMWMTLAEILERLEKRERY